MSRMHGLGSWRPLIFGSAKDHGRAVPGCSYCWCRFRFAGQEQFRRMVRRDAGAVGEQGELSLAGLLRQFRADARLTQEELAEAARLSPRSVSDLERGIHRSARKDTALLLADALGLSGSKRALFIAVARGKVPSAPPTNLPAQLTTFVGREMELSEVRALVAASRLVTLTGAGGCGKTRLGLEVAGELLDVWADGVWLVELAAVADQDAVPAAIAGALGIPAQPASAGAGHTGRCPGAAGRADRAG